MTILDIDYKTARERRGRLFHEGRSVAQADIYETDWEGRPALLKDFSDRPWLVRRWWGRAVLAREVRVLRDLNSVEGVPRLYATAGPEAFIMERLDATRMPGRKDPPPSPAFWANARRLIDQFHEQGIGHGDLRRKNILVGPHDEAYLIDFATTISCKSRGSRWRRFLYQRYRRIDRVTFARIKASYDPAGLDAVELDWLASEPLYLRAGRILKKTFFRFTKPKFYRKRAHRLVRWIRRRFGSPDA